MALRDQPYFPLYIQDYLTDEKLLMCSWETQGIYIRILCNLHKQPLYGCILFKQNSKLSLNSELNYINFFASILIKLIPCQFEEMKSALLELFEFGVLSFDGEKMFQKRMVQDFRTSLARSKAAKKGGGNPVLFKQNNKQTAKQQFKQKDKQNTEYEIENEYENVLEKGVVGGKTISPDFEQVKIFFETFNKPETEARKFYDHYESFGWIINGSLIRKWQPKAMKWIRDDSGFGEKNKGKENAKTYSEASQEVADKIIEQIKQSRNENGAVHSFLE